MAKSVEEIIQSVKYALEQENIYKPILDKSIEDFAQVNYLKTIAFDDAINYDYPEVDDINRNSIGRSILVEQSREGFLRYKVNPAYSIYIDLVRESQKILFNLSMTARGSDIVQGDDYDRLTKEMSNAKNG